MKKCLSVVFSTSIFCSLPILAETETKVLFGDTHLHSAYSFDAFLNDNDSAFPDDAYRWARGLPVIHPTNRVRVQIETPLDFLVVSDHAEVLGVMTELHSCTKVNRRARPSAIKSVYLEVSSR